MDKDALRAERIESLLAEYAYASAALRDESNRLFQVWLALGVVVTATSILLGSSAVPADVNAVAPFGIVVWAALWITQFGAVAGRGWYMHDLEIRLNVLLAAPGWLRYEFTMAKYFESIGQPELGYEGWKLDAHAFLSQLRLPWLINYFIAAIVFVCLVSGFGAAAWVRSEHLAVRIPMVFGMVVGVLLVLHSLVQTFKHLGKFADYLTTLMKEPDKEGGLSQPSLGLTETLGKN